MSRARHLQDERLFDCYLAVQGGEILDPPVAEHHYHRSLAMLEHVDFVHSPSSHQSIIWRHATESTSL